MENFTYQWYVLTLSIHIMKVQSLRLPQEADLFSSWEDFKRSLQSVAIVT